MEHIRFWKANSRAANQDILRFLFWAFIERKAGNCNLVVVFEQSEIYNGMQPDV